MFFILSKILAFIITPIVWIIALLFYSLFSKHQKRKKKSLIIALVAILFFSNMFVFDEAMRLWEIPGTSYEDLTVKYDAGIVLGGIMDYDEKFDRIQFNKSVDRLLQAIELYKLGKIKKIFFSGGSGSITYEDLKEGIFIKRYLLTIGIPKEAILIESESKNTHENAVFSKIILAKELPNGKYLMITSGFHMRRAVGCFKKVGIETKTYSTDRYVGPRKFQFDHLFIPSIDAIRNWNNLIHEVVGYCVYYVSGYMA